MDNIRIERVYTMDQKKKNQIRTFLELENLDYEEPVDAIYAAYDGEVLIGTGAISGQIIKMLAIKADYRGTNLIGQLCSQIMSYGFQMGQDHLFIYTKPENSKTFENLGFYEVCRTDHVALFENRMNGLSDYLNDLKEVMLTQSSIQKEQLFLNDQETECTLGAVVVNCNPFTNGHLHLINTASVQVDILLIFVLSEDRSTFPSEIRIELVRRGTKHLKNVVVLPTGPYMVSQATFPSYFLGETGKKIKVQTELDAKLFGERIASQLNITKRFLGEEPFSETTDAYNKTLAHTLVNYGVKVDVIKRKSIDGEVISASKVRNYIGRGETDAAYKLVPESTREFLMSDEASYIIEQMKREAHLNKRV